MESRNRSLSLIVGGFVLVSLGSLAVGILMLTSESGLFVEHYRIEARFSNVQGLLPGAPVWLAGKQVGRIERVEFTSLGSPEPIQVTMQIDLEVQRRIRSDSVASIGTIGVLGDSYVELRIGTPDGRILGDGDDITTISPTNLYEVLARGTGALDSIQALAENLNRVVDDVQEEGVVAKAASAVSATSDIILELEGGNGLLHSLVYDSYSGGGVESITRSLSSLEHILGAVRSGDGLLNALIYNQQGTGSAQKIDASLSSLANILAEVETGQGLLHNMIYDPSSGELTSEGREVMAQLNVILAHISNGDGTLGLLVTDPSLYEDAQNLISGAQRSSVLRSLIKMAGSD